MKEKRNKIILSLILLVGFSLIIIGAVNIKKEQEIKLRTEEVISDIVVEGTHYIDKSLINIPIAIPFETIPNNIDKNKIIIMSDNSEIIKINDDNTMTALRLGEANITLISKDKKEITAGIHIVVQ